MKQGTLIIFLVLVFSGINQNIIGQTGRQYLALNEAIQSTVSNNNAVKLAALDEQIAGEKYKQTSSIFLPKADFSYTGFSTNNPLNAFGFKLQQQSITVADFNPQKLNNPSSTPDFTTRLDVQQPLVNMDMFYQRKAASTQAEMYKYITGRTKEYLTFKTETAYLQLQMAYAGKNMVSKALDAASAMYKSTQDYYNAGLIQKSDLLNAEVHLKNIETQLRNASSGIENASDALGFLMGKPPGVVYQTDSLYFRESVAKNDTSLPKQRSDFVALQKGMDAYDLMIKSGKMSYLPRLNAFGSYQLNDNKMFGFNSGAYMAGISLSWNIFNGNQTKHTIARQTLEKNKLSAQLEEQQSEASMQLASANRQVNDALFVIQQQQVAVDQAAESLRVTDNRYAKGLVKTTDVLMAQTQLFQQQTQLIQSVYNYNVSLSWLRFIRGN